MRDEDLKNLPQSIEAWKVREFLEGLGIKHSDVYDMHVGVRSVDILVWASDESGQRFVGTDGKTVASHKISIPFVGSWEKPADEQPSIRCAVRRNLGPTGRCILLKDHGGDHSYDGTV